MAVPCFIHWMRSLPLPAARYDAAFMPKNSIKEKSLLLVLGQGFFVGTYMVWVEKTGSSSHSTGCPAARVLGISSKRWLALPRNRRLISY